MEDDDFLAAVEADNTSTPPADPQPPADTPPATEPPPADDTPQTPPAVAADVLVLDTPVTSLETPVATKQPEPGFVPIAAMLDARDRAKAAEAKLAQIEQAQQPLQRPDEYEDPDGARAFDQAQVGRALQNITLNTSERFACKEHGAETVETAKKWALGRFQADPLYQQQILNDPDPYERVVTDWRREQVFAEVSDPKEFEQFKAWKEAQNALQTQPGAQPIPSQTSEIPTPSLASAPSAGSILTEPIQTDEEIFDEVVGKR